MADKQMREILDNIRKRIERERTGTTLRFEEPLIMTVEEMGRKRKAIIADVKEALTRMDKQLSVVWLFGLLDMVAMLAEDAEIEADNEEE